MAMVVDTILLGDIAQRRGTWMVAQMTKVGTTVFVTTAAKKPSTVEVVAVSLAEIVLLLHVPGSVDR